MKRCQDCRHHRYLSQFEQSVCLHPNVAEPSVLNPQRLIGTDAEVVRSLPTYCGAGARWFAERPA